MKKSSCLFIFLLTLCLILSGCGDKKSDNVIRFSTSGEYPPFEYNINGALVGFEIELAKMVAKEMGKQAKFQDMQFSSVLIALQNDMVDAAISTITVTDERKKNFDFSIPYYVESMSIIFPKDLPIKDQSEFSGKKIACQFGTTMEFWLKSHVENTEIVTMDNNPQAIESLKAGYVDGVFIDTAQASAFSKKNPQLDYKIIVVAESGYAIAFKKGSPLKKEVNKALESLKAKGEIQKLKDKYLEMK